MTSMSGAGALPATHWRQDAGLVGLVSIAHLVSHFSQLLLPPLFPWLKDAFGASYTQLGFLMTLFFVVSCTVQAASGFIVDRYGPRPILFGGLALLALAIFGMAASPNYWALAFFAIVAGVGNGVFHPVDYTLLNRKVHPRRLGHAYSAHTVTGSLGWALAPAMLVPLALAVSWRFALAAAGCLATAVLVLLWFRRETLALAAAPKPKAAGNAAHAGESPYAFLRIPSVWMCFWFFFCFSTVLSVVQAFAPEAARQLHAVPVAWAAMCLSIYMVCSAGGNVVGGFLAADPERCERIVGMGFGVAALIALTIGFAPVPAAAVPVLFGGMGLMAGIAGPSRDMLVKRSTPENATGRVYGIVYAGLDIGQAVAPLVFGALMDAHNYHGVWIGLVVMQGVLIASAFNVRRVRRTARPAAA